LVLRRTALNTLQAPSSQVTREGRVVDANVGLYTVPAGKVAKVLSLSGNLDAVGVDATYAIAILRGGTFRPVGQHVAVNSISILQGVLLLQAGDIVTNVGDAGSTNGTMDMTVTIQEFDA